METFLSSFIFIFIAEMGDKTQLLALTFATKFKALNVILSIAVATILTHLLAVIAGRMIASFFPVLIIQIIASLFFIAFGVWTLYNNDSGDTDKGNKLPTTSFFTMTLAFFIAEMGDKSQLATMTLSMKYKTPALVLAGTTLGIICADTIAIILGMVMGKKIPQKIVTFISAIIFLASGIFGLWNNLNEVLH
jgi:putative Ca2+/H+ antiporter (TMEM165/GDT1 family)